VTHEPWFVLLSMALAIQGGYVGLQLAAGSQHALVRSRRLLLAGSALTLAVGIWSMHFVGMLAVTLPQNADFLILPTLISFLTCVIVVGIGLAAISMPGDTRLRIAFGALAMGCGICLMHYIGMSAVHNNVVIEYSPSSVTLALLIAVVTSGIALWMIDRPHGPLPIWLAAIVLGIAVSGMHYMAMAGTSFAICETPNSAASPALSRDSLAIIVACIAFSVSGGFLLSLVPDAKGTADLPRLAPLHEPPGAAFVQEPPADGLHETPIAQIDDVSASETPASSSLPAKSPFADTVVVEKDGRARRLRLSEVRSIRANAHYTYVSDGQQEFFCKLPISTIEATLDPQRFMRVHRSYIVAIDHVGNLRRQGENGLVELNGALVQSDIPVARARLPLLRKRIADRLPLSNGGYPAAVRE